MVVVPVARVAAHKNSAVSKPSRPTASMATTISDQGLASAARSTCERSSPDMPLAALAIQKIIQVTKPTAMIDSSPPISSWASKVRPLGPKVSAAPKPSEMATTAMPTPSQILGSIEPAFGLDQVGHQDADHQSGLEALPQSDQIVGKHPVTLSFGPGLTRGRGGQHSIAARR